MFCWWTRRLASLAGGLLLGGLIGLPARAEQPAKPPPLPSIAARRLVISGHYDSQGKLEGGRIVWWEWKGEVVVTLGRARVETELVRYEAKGTRLSFPRGLRLLTEYLDLSASQGEVFPNQDRFVLGEGAEGEVAGSKLSAPIKVKCERVEGRLTASGGGVINLTGGVEVSSKRINVAAPEVVLDLTNGRLSVPPDREVEAELKLPSRPRPPIASSVATLLGWGLEAGWQEGGKFSFKLGQAEVRLDPITLVASQVEGEGDREQGLVRIESPKEGGQVRLILGEFPEPGQTTSVIARRFHLEVSERRLVLAGGVVLESPTGRMETEQVWLTYLSPGDYVIELPSQSRVVIDEKAVRAMLEGEREEERKGSGEASPEGG